MRDISLDLMAGDPIYLEKVGHVHSPLVKEIKDVTEQKYQEYLSMIMINKESVELDTKENEELTNYDIIFALCLQDKNFLDRFVNSLSFFLKQPITFVEDGVFVVGEIKENILEENGFLTRDNYSDFVEIVRKQNGIKKPKQYKAANDAAQKMIEKIKKNNKEKPKTQDEPSLADIVSSIYWKSNKSKEEIWGMTIFELYNGLQRLNIIDDYSNTMLGVYTGNIDTKKMNLKKVNWMKPIKDEES